jgi:hypothetical protein
MAHPVASLPNMFHGYTLPSDIRDAIACDPRDAIVDAFAIITRRRAVSPRLPHTSHQAMRPPRPSGDSIAVVMVRNVLYGNERRCAPPVREARGTRPACVPDA